MAHDVDYNVAMTFILNNNNNNNNDAHPDLLIIAPYKYPYLLTYLHVARGRKSKFRFLEVSSDPQNTRRVFYGITRDKFHRPRPCGLGALGF